MLGFKRSPLNLGYFLMYVSKALVSVDSIWSLHVTLLSNTTPTYFTFLTKVLCHLFSCSTTSGTQNSSREIDRLSFLFTDLYVAALITRHHCSEAALNLVRNTMFMLLCPVCTGTICENSPLLMRTGSRDSSVGIATGYGLDEQGEREFESR
jgi:hypothetical protein